MFINPPYTQNIGFGRGNPAHMPVTPKKIAVYGSYKKGFHNHELLGEDAKFLGLSKIKGVMYMIEGVDPYPLFYIDSIRQNMLRDYTLELYEIEAEKYIEIQTRELRDNGRHITVTVDKDTYHVFVTDKAKKTEPKAGTYIKEFNKHEFSAYIQGPVTVYALDKERAEEQLKNMFEEAATCLDIEKHEEAALVLTGLTCYITEKKKEEPTPSPIQQESIQTN